MLTAKQLNASNKYAEESELEYITNLLAAHENEFPIVVMLGAGPGVFALAAYEGNPDILLTIIDNDTTQWASTHLEAAGHKNFFVINEDSAETGTYWYEDVDLLIVDADHSYEGVKRDIEAWFPNVNSGGYLFFHDHWQRDGGFNGTGEWVESGVSQAIDEFDGDRWEFIAEVGISVVYRKR